MEITIYANLVDADRNVVGRETVRVDLDRVDGEEGAISCVEDEISQATGETRVFGRDFYISNMDELRDALLCGEDD